MQFVFRAVLGVLIFTSAAITQDAADFSACPQFLANSQPPKVTPSQTNRALSYDAFAILHSGESKTAVFVAQKFNRASVEDADERRLTMFIFDARFSMANRATIGDHKYDSWSRGHLAPVGDMTDRKRLPVNSSEKFSPLPQLSCVSHYG